VAERIIAAYLLAGGASRAEIVTGSAASRASGIDIVVLGGPESRRIKVKADPYFGTDERKVADRALSFYRADTESYAFEAVANSITREPGWTLASDAQDLYYYCLALLQSPDEIGALLVEPDDVFFSELSVERDELTVLPMQAVRTWFGQHHPEYVPRPVMFDGYAAWCRLVPRHDVERAIPGVRRVGPVFGGIAL
jgi:hypothetical protein